jgi:hypothetical protein
MFRRIRVPAALDQFFCTMKPHVRWDHWTYVRVLVLVIAVAWGRRTVANLYRYLDVPYHRSRFNHFFLVARWAPEAALRQKARERLQALHPQPGDTVDLVIDDSKQAKRGTAMDAVAKRRETTTEADIRGQQDVCAILLFRHDVIPWGLRLYVQQAHCAALECPFRKTTEVAAPLLRAFTPPDGVDVMVLFEAYALCHTVVQACREQRFHVASTLKSHRSLFKQGWKLKAGRAGRKLFRRRRTTSLVSAKPQGHARYRWVDAGWLAVSTLGNLPVVFARQGTARTILGLVTETPALSAAGLIQASEKRWAVEQFVKDTQQLLGLGPDQHRPYWAAVIPLHLVGFAYALLPHLRLTRDGAQGQRPYQKAAGMSVTAAQEALRSLVWDDLVTYLQEKHHGEAVLAELEHLRVA